MLDEHTNAPLGGRYRVEQLAPGSYDLLLDDRLIGGIVRNVGKYGRLDGWRVELLDTVNEHDRPYPFTAAERSFTGLEAALSWLGVPSDGVR